MGKVRIEVEALARKLGPRAMAVWELLHDLRDERGKVSLSLAEIGKRLRIRRNAIKRPVLRLEDASLISKPLQKERSVYGELGAKTARVPKQTERWLKEASGWGGHRMPKVCTLAPEFPENTQEKINRKQIQDVTHNPSSITLGSSVHKQDPPAELCTLAPDFTSSVNSQKINRKQIQDVTRNTSSSTLGSSVHDEHESTTLYTRARARQTLTLTSLNDYLSYGKIIPPPLRVVGSSFISKEGAQSVQSIGPSIPIPPKIHPAAFGRYKNVPFISVASICPRVPAPPLLDDSESEQGRAVLLARWYTGAVESRTGKRCWTFVKSFANIARSKHYRTLVAAAAKLVEHNIPPAAWCAFSCDAWQRDIAPPVSWVFSVKRIEQKRGWYRSESQDYAGGTIIYSEKAKALLHRLAKMRLDIWRAGDITDESLAGIVQLHFPNDKFISLVEEIRFLARKSSRQLNDKAKQGGWFW